MTGEPERTPSCTWEEATFRSTTDREFRKSLLENPTHTLRSLGLLGLDQTAVAFEWKPQEVILTIPPFKRSAHQLQQHVAELRKELGLKDREVPSPDKPGEPASKTPASDILRGPAIASISVMPRPSGKPQQG